MTEGMAMMERAFEKSGLRQNTLNRKCFSDGWNAALDACLKAQYTYFRKRAVLVIDINQLRGSNESH